MYIFSCFRFRNINFSCFEMSWVDSAVILSWYVWQTKTVDQSLVEFGPIVLFVTLPVRTQQTDRQKTVWLKQIYAQPTKKTPKNILQKL